MVIYFIWIVHYITNQKGREKLNNIYKNYILATKESYNELKDSAIYEDIYSKKYIDLIYHVCQKLKDINFKNIIYEELGGLKVYFTTKHKIYYYFIKININNLYYLYKLLRKNEE